MQKYALVAFNGEQMCFVHVLLNGLDMHERGYDVTIIIEGAATKLIPDLVKDGNPFKDLFSEATSLGLIAGACKACSNKMGVLSDVEREGITLLADMTGHPSIARYAEDGYQIITF